MLGAACSDGDANTTSSEGASEPSVSVTTATTTTAPTTTTLPITKTEFVEQANAICDAGNATIEADPGSNAPGPVFFVETIIPSIRQQVTEIRTLGFPEGDGELLEKMLGDTETVLADLEVELEADPESFGSGPNPFAETNQALADYGLNVCASG